MSDSQSAKTLFLLTSNSLLQTDLLAKLIEAETSTPCRVTTSLEGLDASAILVLFDCSGHSPDELTNLIREFHVKLPDVPAALLNAQYDSEYEQLLDWPCIFGIFYTDSDQDQLIRGLEQILDGDYWVPRKLLHHFLHRNRRAPSNSRLIEDINLTKREKQILKLIKEGATNLSIAEYLEVSEHTVKSHLYNVYKKIGVKNRLEASNWIREMEL